MHARQFELSQLGEGVWAAIAAPGAAAFSNAGIVDLGDATLVVDSFDTTTAGEELAVAAEVLTGRPADWLVITHSHRDHWGGAQAFDQAVTIATRAARDRIERSAQELAVWAADPAPLAASLARMEEQLAAEADPARRALLSRTIERQRFLLEHELAALRPRVPELTFDSTVALHGRRRTAYLAAVGHLHSPGDATVTLPGKRIAFTGDLLFVGRQPYMSDSEPDRWAGHLAALETGPFETFVPGHGPLATRADVALLRGYLAAASALVSDGIAEGLSADEIVRQPLPEPYAAWDRALPRSEMNLRFLYERMVRSRT